MCCFRSRPRSQWADLTGNLNSSTYEAGLDVMDTDDPVESFGLFQGAIVNEYDAMVDEFGLTVIDGTRPIYTQQQEMRAIMAEKLGDYLTRSVPPRRGSTARRRTPAKASTAKRPTAASTRLPSRTGG